MPKTARTSALAPSRAKTKAPRAVEARDDAGVELDTAELELTEEQLVAAVKGMGLEAELEATKEPAAKATRRRAGASLPALGETSQNRVAEAYERWAPMVRRIASRYERDPALAEDLASEVWVRIMASLDKFRGESGMGTWIFKVAVRGCLSHARKEATRIVVYENRMSAANASGGAREEGTGSWVEDVSDAGAMYHSDCPIVPRAPLSPEVLTEHRLAVERMQALVNEIGARQPKSARAVMVVASSEPYKPMDLAPGESADAVRCSVARARELLAPYRSEFDAVLGAAPSAKSKARVNSRVVPLAVPYKPKSVRFASA